MNFVSSHFQFPFDNEFKKLFDFDFDSHFHASQQISETKEDMAWTIDLPGVSPSAVTAWVEEKAFSAALYVKVNGSKDFCIQLPLNADLSTLKCTMVNGRFRASTKFRTGKGTKRQVSVEAA